MDRRQVLSALSRVEIGEGTSALASGHVQDVLLEPFGDGVYVAVVVDPLWEGRAPAPSATQAIEAAVAALPGVSRAKVVLRERPPRPSHRPGPPQGLPAGSRVLAVASGKGGVGKSTVSVNLAVAAARLGRRAAIIDCDMYGYSVPQLIGLTAGPSVDADTRRIKPPLAHGVSVMSLEFFVPGNDPVSWRGPMLGKALRQFVSTTDWSDEEIFILDLPPGTGDMLLNFHDFFAGSDVLVVTTPDPFAARVAERAGEMARRVGHRVIGVVENMAYLTCPECSQPIRPWGAGGADAVARHLGTKVIARLPLAVGQAAPEGAVAPHDSELGHLYEALARSVIGNAPATGNLAVGASPHERGGDP